LTLQADALIPRHSDVITEGTGSEASAVTRVMVIGNAGGGKSTLCRDLCQTHGLPYYAIDKIQWRPNWVRAPEAEFNARHLDLISRERWLIDGYGLWPSVEARLEACDTIILVDHPIHIHFWWAAKRQITSLFVERPDGPEDCPMWPVTIRLFKMMWQLHREMRPKLIDAIYGRKRHARIIHIRSPKDLNRFRRNPV